MLYLLAKTANLIIGYLEKEQVREAVADGVQNIRSLILAADNRMQVGTRTMATGMYPMEKEIKQDIYQMELQ